MCEKCECKDGYGDKFAITKLISKPIVGKSISVNLYLNRYQVENEPFKNSIDSVIETAEGGVHYTQISINYCPFCGRDLKEE